VTYIFFGWKHRNRETARQRMEIRSWIRKEGDMGGRGLLHRGKSCTLNIFLAATSQPNVKKNVIYLAQKVKFQRIH
jgi:hypothetical protein